MDPRKARYLARSRATSRPQTTRREARLFSTQTVEFSKRPRMNNMSCRRDRTPYCSPAVPEGEKPVPHELKAISGQHADVRETTPLEVD